MENSLGSLFPVASITLCILTLVSVGWYYYSFLSSATPYHMYDTYELPSMQLYSCEYLPEGSLLSDISEARYACSEGLNFTDVRKAGTHFSCHIKNGNTEGYLEIPMTCYKGYVATHKETQKELTISKGFNNCIKVSIPENFSGNIEVEFVKPVYWKVAEIITGFSILLLIGFGGIQYIIFSKKKKGTL